jgi:hypothetical protein
MGMPLFAVAKYNPHPKETRKPALIHVAIRIKTLFMAIASSVVAWSVPLRPGRLTHYPARRSRRGRQPPAARKSKTSKAAAATHVGGLFRPKPLIAHDPANRLQFSVKSPPLELTHNPTKHQPLIAWRPLKVRNGKSNIFSAAAPP